MGFDSDSEGSLTYLFDLKCDAIDAFGVSFGVRRDRVEMREALDDMIRCDAILVALNGRLRLLRLLGRGMERGMEPRVLAGRIGARFGLHDGVVWGSLDGGLGSTWAVSFRGIRQSMPFLRVEDWIQRSLCPESTLSEPCQSRTWLLISRNWAF